MSFITIARNLWLEIRNEKVRNANTAERVGDAGAAILDAVESKADYSGQNVYENVGGVESTTKADVVLSKRAGYSSYAGYSNSAGSDEDGKNIKETYFKKGTFLFDDITGVDTIGYPGSFGITLVAPWNEQYNFNLEIRYSSFEEAEHGQSLISEITFENGIKYRNTQHDGAWGNWFIEFGIPIPLPIATWEDLNRTDLIDGEYAVTGFRSGRLSITKDVSILQVWNDDSNTLRRRIDIADPQAYPDWEDVYVKKSQASQIQSDFNQTDDTAKDFIKNKPTIPTAVNGITPTIGVNGNWYYGTTDTGIRAQGTNGTPAPLNISLFKTGANGIVYPQRFKWTSSKTISSVQLMTNCISISVTIGATNYDQTSIIGVTLPTGTELVINDILIQTGYNNANAIIILS